ncbi:MAG: hypothetical protein IPO92_14910 [Saprospiraceae bacterium]|nr:hypothetical protein [Saprospiraceae bacterium]
MGNLNGRYSIMIFRATNIRSILAPFVNNDGNIDLLGFVRLDTMFSRYAPSWPHDASKPALVVKYTVDVENGKILSRQTSKDSIQKNLRPRISNFIYDSALKEYVLYFPAVEFNSATTLNYTFTSARLDGDLSLYPYGKITIKEDLIINPYSEMIITALNDSVRIGIYNNYNNPDSSKFQFVWMTNNDLSQNKISKKLNFEEYIHLPLENQLSLTYDTEGDNVFALNSFRMEDFGISKINVLWVDHNSDVKKFMQEVAIDNHFYFGLDILKLTDHGFIAQALPGINGFYSFDIIEYNEDTNEFILLSSIMPSKQDLEISWYGLTYITEEDNLVLKSAARYSGEYSNYNFVACFDGQDLGLTVPTIDYANDDKIFIYPNPTSNLLTITNGSFDKQTLIQDALGKLVMDGI